MTRVIQLGDRFRTAAERLGIVPGSERARAVARVIAVLGEADDLPSPGDARALIPPTSEAFVRRVPGRNLWIWYRVSGDVSYLVHVSSEPPIPITAN